jgi:2-C-methyl-D-erythritol 4-phosphate cytidylyltransferase
MNIAIILAGGVGSRVGADRPKQFIEILGKPVLAYTVEKFNNHPLIDAVEIVCVESHIEYLREMVNKYNLDKVKWITKGGATFQGSVMNGVNNLKYKISDDDVVLVHFGASPFVEEDIITDAIEVCKEKGNAISTCDFFLLSGIKDDNTKSSTWIDRDSIACMNSPHAFKYKFIYDIYQEAVETGVIDEVEPHTTTLMYKMGKTIYFSKGNQTNIKITTKEDLDLFEGYVLMKQKRLAENQ